MSRADDFFAQALKGLPEKPAQNASQQEKKRYSELFSQATAAAFGEELRVRGLKGTRPSLPGEAGASGAERRLYGGIGAKKVDVSWALEESGLLLGISIKSIHFMDQKTSNFQKNLTNRRGDMLFEAVTLHRRFPYAVLVGFLFLDWQAAEDGTERRKCTLDNAHDRLRLFTGRNDPDGREEQYERLYVGKVDGNKFAPKWELFEAGKPGRPITISQAFDELIELLAERNFDWWQASAGELTPIG